MYRTVYDKENKLWNGLDVPPLFNPKISLVQLILRVCKNYGPKIAQISDDSGIRLSFDEIRIKTIRAAQNLQRLGHNRKYVFGVVAKNSYQLAPIIFASIAIGNPVNVLDPSFGKTEYLHMLTVTEPVLMFCDADVFELVKECLNELNNNAKVFTFGGHKNCSVDVERLFVETHNESSFIPVEVDGETEAAIIVCTSGTTGLHKGVCLSHAGLLNLITQFDVINSTNVVLCFSSLYGITGWLIFLWGTISGSTRIITTQSFSVDLQLSLIEKYKVTFAHNPPYQLALILKSDSLNSTDLSSLKYQSSSGSPIPLHIKQGMISRMKNGIFYTRYGITESSGVISMNSSCSESVGQLWSYCVIKIINENGKRCGVGEDGEICFKSNYRFLGYYRNEEATNASLDEEGFFLTGDIGHFDDDGNLHIVERKKDIIICNGFHVLPSKIESHLMESFKINFICVVGIRNEALATELPTAFIVRNEASNITEKDVSDTVAGHFADHWKLRGGVYFVDFLPTTPSGKILRRKLTELANDLENRKQ